MNICLITHLKIWNNSQGADSYINNIINNFSEDNIYLVYLGKLSKNDLKNVKNINSKIKEIICINSMKVYFRRALKRLLSIIKLNKFYSLKKPFRYSLIDKKKMSSIVKKYSIDSILVNYVWYYDVVSDVKNIKKIMITHDIQNQFCDTERKNGAELFLDITENDEICILKKFDLVACISSFDLNYFNKRLNNTIYLPPTVKFNNIEPKERYKNCFGFIGGEAKFNVDGLNWFIENCLPHIKGDYTFNVYGKVVKQISCSNAKVVMHGYIENVEDVYKNNSFMINPNFIGGGLKIKNIEALANNRPLITTSLGAQGFENGCDKCLIVSNTAEEFVNSIQAFLDDYNMVHKYQSECEDFVRTNFGKDIFNEFYSSLKKEI